MNIRRFTARNSRDALIMVRQALGDDAVVLSTRPGPEGVEVRRVTTADDMVRIGALESRVWDEDWSWLADELTEAVARDPEHTLVFVAEAGHEVVLLEKTPTRAVQI